MAESSATYQKRLHHFERLLLALDLVDLPPDRKTVAILAAQGYTQRYGTDYDETFCPVVRQKSLRTLMALSVQYGLKFHQIDVTTAFLNGTLEEEVFMRHIRA